MHSPVAEGGRNYSHEMEIMTNRVTLNLFKNSQSPRRK